MKKYLLFILAVIYGLLVYGNEKENTVKGQINQVAAKMRSFNSFSHQDYMVFKSDFSNWKQDGYWQSGKRLNEKCIGVGLESTYSSNLNTRFISQQIQLPLIDKSGWEKIVLSFDEFFSLESDYDLGYIEISDDGGESWTILDSRSGTIKSDWASTELYLDYYSGKKILLAFHFISDESFSGEGWFIKNLKIEKSIYMDRPNRLLNAQSKNILKSSGDTGLSGTLSSLNSQNFPYIYMNILLTEDGAGVSNLTKQDFNVYEDDALVSDYSVVPPDATSGAKLVDIVFLVDNSGSFDDEQNAVRNNMEDFVNQLTASGNDFALGLCRFGQYSQSGYPILEDNGQLTNNSDYFKNTVWLRNVTNGSIEVGYNAIVKSAQGFNFRPGSQKIFIILTDETPDQGGSTKQEATDACLNNYITLFAMTNYKSAGLNDIATATNGRYYNITDPFNDILADITTSVNNNYLISYKSPNTTLDGIERQVKVNATSSTGSSTDITGSYVPGAAPKITRTTETINFESQGWDEGTSFDITVEVTDNQEPLVQEVTLFYKHSDSDSYTSTTMSNTSGDIWSGTIPASVCNRPGVDYYITATDGEVTSSLPKVEPNVNPFQIAILPNVMPVITHTVPAASFSPGQLLTFIANVVDNTNQVSSTKLFYRNIGDLLFTSIDMTNTSGDEYGVDLTTPSSAEGIEYYIVAEDDFGLKGYWASADNPQAISSGQQANFKPYIRTDANWSSEMVVGIQENATDDAVLYDDETLYINFAYINDGNAVAGVHEIEFYVDNVLNYTWDVTFTSDPGWYVYLANYQLGTLTAGNHTLLVKIDSQNQVVESDETDNEIIKVITVLTSGTELPNLNPYALDNWDAAFFTSNTEGETTKTSVYYDDEDVFLNLAYANMGDGNAGSHVSHIYIDETADTLYWDVTDGLDSYYYNSITDYNYGKMSVGQHIFRFVIDANNEVVETDESDNEITDTITVLPRYQPNLLPYKPANWDDAIVVSNTTGTYTNSTAYTTDDDIYIDGAFENNGDIASTAYYVRIYVDGLLYTFEDVNGIDLTTYKYIEDFHVGKLSEGSHDITLFVDCFDDVAELDETDNSKTITINVGSATGIDSPENGEDIRVWPTPSSTSINIEFGRTVNTTLGIFDLSGRLIHETKVINEKSVMISTENINNGIYMLRAIDNDLNFTRKIVVRK